MKQLLQEAGVTRVKGDMCEFDMFQHDGSGVGRIKKSTGFATNSKFIADQLAVACKGHHRHIQLVSGRAKRAEIYPEKLCRAIVKGLIDQHKLWVPKDP